jgi:hypothetical protein
MTEEVQDTNTEKTERDKKFEGLSTARQVVLRLSEEIEKVASERGKTYGDPEDNFSNIAAMWNAYLRGRFGEEYSKKYPLHSYDVGYFMALQKLARIAKTPLHPDSALDAMNYVGLGLGCAMWEDQLMAAAIKEYFERMKAQAEAQQKAEADAATEETEPPAEHRKTKREKA